jgi:clan AA aspartic protease (TIGR02281 family)
MTFGEGWVMNVHRTPFACTLLILIACALFPKAATAQYSVAQCTSVMEALNQSIRDTHYERPGDPSYKRVAALERRFLTFCQAHLREDEYVVHLGTLAEALNYDNQNQEALGVANSCLRISANDLSCLKEKAVALGWLRRVSEAKSIVDMALSLGAITERDVAAQENLRSLQQSIAAMMARASSASPPNQIPSSAAQAPLKKKGGTFVVPVLINGVIPLDFTVDSGAAVVTVPSDVFSTLRRTGTITDSDITGEQTYVLANGSETKGITFTIRSLRVGDKVAENVRASVVPDQGGLLLGQSFLERFKSWSFNNTKHQLVLEPQ